MKFQSLESIADQVKHPLFSKELFLGDMAEKDYLIGRLVSAKFHAEGFLGKITGFTTNLADVVTNAPIDLKVGDLVAFTNENGSTYVNNKVLGFDLTPDYKRVVYLDFDCYWFPVELDTLIIQSGYVGVDEADLQLVEAKYQTSHIPFEIQRLRARQQVA